MVIADGLQLPYAPIIDWHAAVITIPEKELAHMTSAAELVARLPTGAALRRMRTTIHHVSERFFHGSAVDTVREQALAESVRIVVNQATRSAR